MLASAAALLLLLVLDLVAPLDSEHKRLVSKAAVAAWATFTAAYALRIVYARDRLGFVRDNLIDTAVVLTGAAALTAPSSSVLLVLRLLSAMTMVFEIGKDLQHLLRVKNIPYAIVGATLVIIVCGALEFRFENAAKGANIHSPQDGAWWALVTASTVGYGDTYPITAEGRMVAAGLIILSPVFLGILYAGIAATLLKPTLEEILDKERKEDERMARVMEKKLEEKIAQHFGPIKEQLDRMLEQKAQP